MWCIQYQSPFVSTGMAYRTYTTEALVVGSEEGMAADRSILLFTRDAGLVRARAVSVRLEQSKLRYGLQDLSLVTVSLVRGKQGWRVVGAERSTNLYFHTDDRTRRAALLRAVRLVRRLVRGEESHSALYDLVLDGIGALLAILPEELPRAERLFVLRLLSVLGYVAPHGAYAHAITAPSLHGALSADHEPAAEERAATRAIDRALSVSQL